ncbi:MAG TPA: cytochrome c biogenesis protein CcdA [Candidatus Paceibacterota bacterium]|nr:cytochrome c biogenesis protein CcdA [Candidatus Paceibacterota bacterium]
MLLFLISFIAGVLTVLAPCVLPLLPVIVGGSLAQGGRWRAYTICFSLGVSVIVFTLLLKASTIFINIPQTFWEWFSGIILVLFGLVMVFPSLWDRLGFVNLMNRSSNKLLAEGYQRNSRVGDMIMGAALGPVFSSCSPTYFVILATVLPQSFAAGFLDLLAYAVGLSGFLFIIALAGQKLVDRLGVTINPTGWFRRGIGILFILIGLLVATGAEASAEAWLLNHGFDLGGVEEQLLGAQNSTSSSVTTTSTSTALLSPSEKAMVYKKSPELASIDGYINTNGKPITIGQYKGNDVVLVDFWTYSCINCQRTIPYLEAWYKKYAPYGFVIIGVSTPEFAFEHVYDNVANAVKQFGITYLVVLDNEYGTWNAFSNEYWPNDFLVDIDGYIVYNHAGEGDYDGAEAAIQKALIERAARLGLPTPDFNATSTTPSNMIPINFNGVQSPETYFGSERNEYLGNGQPGISGVQNFDEPQQVDLNTLYLVGQWDIEDQYAQTGSDVGGSVGSDRVDYKYDSKNVYFVAGSATGKAIPVEVLLDSKPLDASVAGKDVYFKDGMSYVDVNENRLYDIVAGKDYGEHFLEFVISQPGLQAYTFTFG